MNLETFPLVIAWEMTLACNLRCAHCGSSAGLKRQHELTLGEMLAVCDELPELLVQEVHLTGGEPLLNPAWYGVAERLGALGIATKLISNGLGLTPEVASRVREAGIGAVGLSLDGLSTSHDYTRGSAGAFYRVIAAIEHLRAAGVGMTVITTVTAKNLDELPMLCSLLSSVGVHDWQLQPLVPMGRGQEARELVLTDEMYLRTDECLVELREMAASRGIRIVAADSFGYFGKSDIGLPEWRGCPAGVFGCSITSDGKVKGCVSMPDEMAEGDLRERHLWDIWFDPDAFRYTRQWVPADLGPLCADCDRAVECRGGCTTKSLAMTGHIGNDPYCYHRAKYSGDPTTPDGKLLHESPRTEGSPEPGQCELSPGTRCRFYTPRIRSSLGHTESIHRPSIRR